MRNSVNKYDKKRDCKYAIPLNYKEKNTNCAILNFLGFYLKLKAKPPLIVLYS